jgi:tripartite-type tricarboxylate transporter receptor subunit TctC
MVPIRRRAALGLAAAALAAPAVAQGFPSKPIVVLVPFPAGGTTDAQMRVLAAEASQVFRQQVLIENRPGAGSTLGAATVARARPDGYLLTQLTAPCLRLPFMQPMSYDVTKDFTPVLHLTGYLFGICVRADSPWKTWQDFVADARRRPGAIAVGNTGANGTPHLAVVQLAERENLQLTHVPFRGEGDGMPALMGGHIQAMACGSGGGGLVDEGRARWLNVWTSKRSKRWPDVPTLVELGYPELVITSPYGLVGPAGMDAELTRRLQDGFAEALRRPAHLAALERHDMELDYRDSAGYAAFIQQQLQVEEALVRRLNLRTG